jgi:ATP-dependent helicase/nuclease subunit B
VQTRFLLGPAGSGKTFRCLAEIRAALAAAPDGPPLLLIAPKQTTYQLERQLLAGPSLAGYTRLRILSFERLAFFILDQLQHPLPRMLDEEGRLMVLRSLLAKKRDQLRLFRASARLTGFARHLSLVLRELQIQQLTPESIAKLADEVSGVESLRLKLHDLATLLRDYLDWLSARNLHDADYLLDYATQILRAPHPSLALGEVWVDGFTELPPQELDFLAEILPHAAAATITFCLDSIPTEKISWLSNWSVVRRTWHQCKQRLAGLPNCHVTTELLPRHVDQSRFSDNQILRHLEAHWAEPIAYSAMPTPKPSSLLPLRSLSGRGEGWGEVRVRAYGERDTSTVENSPASLTLLKSTLRIAECANPEAEAVLAAREILRFVRAGGRYREVTVLARNLESYHAPLANVFARYEIPFFLDRRESVSHHPLAELSRNALRTVAYSWTHDDWFAALKTGLVPAAEVEIDRLENEALARGWKGAAWLKPISIADEPQLTAELERLCKKIVPPFEKLALGLQRHGNKPTGAQLAETLRELWRALGVAETLQAWSASETGPNPIQLTVWEQMNAWLENLELAFSAEPLPLREWLPILEAGLAGLTVGVIPPALDQVSIGAIDRSRNPDIRLALVLGMNETVFPAPPAASVLLTDADRLALEKQGVSLATARHQIGRERYFGYIACTRSRSRLVLSFSQADAAGKTLNPSPFLSHFQQLFPALEIEKFPRAPDWRKSEHRSELIVPLLRHQARGHAAQIIEFAGLDDFLGLRGQLRHLLALPEAESLAPALAAQLYGAALGTSVSRMEQFAACPFKFFVHSGLRAEERKLFELDIRDQGNFQHEVLALFHDQLRADDKRWRDITPAEARVRIKSIAASMMVSFRDGLLQSSDEGRFTARILAESLQDFVETLVGWMREQYAFDPMQVELPFDDKSGGIPPLELDLKNGHRLSLHGRIDRIDICREEGTDAALCVVVDYKSSQKQLDSLLMEHGLQLQLPAYLSVLRHWPDPRPLFGVGRLIPAGVFYVNLRGKYERGENRDETLADVEAARKRAYRHSGRFNVETLDKLDQRADATEGDQFNYRRNRDGTISGNSREAMDPAEFIAMLNGVETALKKMGRAIYDGVAKVDPYRKGNVTACEQCDYRSVCRIDPWTHRYRVLRKISEEGE